ncbi:MAG: DUF892 family protein [Candidatus Eisenbacteria bacterium]|uniref:DUF892 family protein n=1 Tax=Eiseniibacteriota bacterium TaxID=2212470 RepID=A0A7Y2ECX5_UNCEI|nr:DUF892 family protein [Candidatus Eisenbacteria bacterium]
MKTEGNPPFGSLDKLLIRYLGELYDSEHRITDLTPQFRDASANETVREVFRRNFVEIQQRIQLLEAVFRSLDCEPIRFPSYAGLVSGAEAEAWAETSEFKNAVDDIALLTRSIQLQEHSLVGYSAAKMWARSLGLTETTVLLRSLINENAKSLTSLETTLEEASSQVAEDHQKFP